MVIKDCQLSLYHYIHIFIWRRVCVCVSFCYLPYWLSCCILRRRGVEVEHPLQSNCKNTKTVKACGWMYLWSAVSLVTVL